MGKKIIGKRELSKILEDRKILVEQALHLGKLTRKDICNATGLSMTELANLFQKDREIYHKYSIMRRTVVDVAADNIVNAVMDPNHPKNYDASKEVLKNWKSDLDDILDSRDGTEIKIEGGSNAKSPVKIVFGDTSSKKKDK